MIAAPLERRLEDGLESLLHLERHTKRVVAEERTMREELEAAGLKMTLRMEHAPLVHVQSRPQRAVPRSLTGSLCAQGGAGGGR